MTDEEFKKMRKRAEQELEALNRKKDEEEWAKRANEKYQESMLGENWKNILSGMGDQ